MERPNGATVVFWAFKIVGVILVWIGCAILPPCEYCGGLCSKEDQCDV